MGNEEINSKEDTKNERTLSLLKEFWSKLSQVDNKWILLGKKWRGKTDPLLLTS